MKQKHFSEFESLQAKRLQGSSSETAQKGIDSFLIHNSPAIPKKILVEVELSKEEIERAEIEAVTVLHDWNQVMT